MACQPVLPGTVPVTLVQDINLRVAAGDFLAITGPSGSGKSSLLYLLVLLDEPTEGEITLLGIGPLTNISTLFKADPEIPGLLKSLVLMCGVFADGFE